MLVIIDDATRFVWIHVAETRVAAIEWFKNYLAKTERQLFPSDCGRTHSITHDFYTAGSLTVVWSPLYLHLQRCTASFHVSITADLW